MSSNIRVNKICRYCEKEFEARKTSSKTCSDSCAKMLYKARKRSVKIEGVVKETQAIKAKPIEALKAKAFLSVNDTAELLSCSRQTIYSLINTGKIKGVNIKIKKTLIARSEINKLFGL